MTEEIELTVTKPLTELQLTKDSSVQAIPLSNEAYKNKLNGMGTSRMTMFKAKQKVTRVEERYIEADSKKEVLELIDWEDAGEDNAHFETIDESKWEIEEDE
jgi:hypothetical protein